MPPPSRIARQTSWSRLAVFVVVVLALAWWGWQGRVAAPSGPDEVRPPEAGTATPTAPPAAASDIPTPVPAPASPVYDLARDEGRGGHTLARHVGRTDADLRARLARERGISAASTYPDRATAERVVAATLAREAAQVRTWSSRRGARPNLALDYRGRTGAVIGRSLRRGAREPVVCIDAVVVLRWEEAGGFYVLTSYPEARR